MGLIDTLRSSRHRQVLLVALLLLAPNFIGFLIFTLGPVVFSAGMALTDWNLARHGSGSVAVQWVGVQNFVRLLGFHRGLWSSPADHPWLWLGLFGGLVLAAVGTAAAAWRLRKPKGYSDDNPDLRYMVLLAVGGLLAVSVVQTALDGTWHAHPRLGMLWPAIRFIVAVGCVAAVVRHLLRDYEAGEARRLLLLAGSLLGCLGFGWLAVKVGYRTFAIWEPNSRTFWLYFYNTVFLMIGLPLSIAGSLVMALILYRTVEVAGWRRRVLLAAAVLVIGAGGAFVLHRLALGFSVDLLALIAAACAIAALGILFGTTAFRTILYLPSLSMSVATFILWQKMFNPEIGPINNFLRSLFDTAPFEWIEGACRWWNPLLGEAWELTPPEWLLDPAWAKPALILMGVWAGLGSNSMLLYLAGLANISPELYEAADIDGASRWRRFWNVTWPQLAPTTFFITVMGCIGGLQGGFEQARVMTSGGPAGSTTTLSYFLYTEAFELSNMGYGCAIAWALFAIVFALTMVNWRFGNELVNYE